MPDILDANGLQLKTVNEIIAQLETRFREIYGVDINLEQNSPDGQMINIFAQAAIDLREVLRQVYNSFNPDRAVGRLLDERVAINNIQRAGGTFTIVAISIVVDRTVTLPGLDTQFNDVNGTGYTVQDDAGNQFILVDTSVLTAGTHSLNFRAQAIGQVETIINTIVNPVTVVLGVVSVNNPNAALQVGQNEETDAQLRTRRQNSVAIASSGYLNGLLGAVLQLPGVTDAKLYENYTNVTDSNGIPPHATWLIVEGGANEDIAQVYYEKKSYGSNMRGAVEVDITTPSGAIFTAQFDRPTAEDLYIRFDIQPTVANPDFPIAAIKESMVDAINYNIGQFAETATITAAALAAIIENGGGGVPVNVEISNDGTNWDDYLDTATLDNQFTLDVTRITITEL